MKYGFLKFPSLDGRGKGRVTPLPNPLPQGEREHYKSCESESFREQE